MDRRFIKYCINNKIPIARGKREYPKIIRSKEYGAFFVAESSAAITKCYRYSEMVRCIQFVSILSQPLNSPNNTGYIVPGKGDHVTIKCNDKKFIDTKLGEAWVNKNVSVKNKGE